jgi:hypothetical protein
MIDLIRQSAVPSNVLRSASRGALELPPAEMIEVLVCLAAHPVFGEQARMTLASWDEPACRAVCADPNSPREVLAYFLAAHNRRPRLMPALLANPAISEAELLLVAQEHSQETVALLLASARVCASPNVLQALSSNPMLTPQQHEFILQALGSRQHTAEAPPSTATAEEAQADAELDCFLSDFLNEHNGRLWVSSLQHIEQVGHPFLNIACFHIGDAVYHIGFRVQFCQQIGHLRFAFA